MQTKRDIHTSHLKAYLYTRIALDLVRHMGHLLRLLEHSTQVHMCPQLWNTVLHARSRHMAHVLSPSAILSASAALPLSACAAALAAALCSSTLLTRSLLDKQQNLQHQE